MVINVTRRVSPPANSCGRGGRGGGGGVCGSLPCSQLARSGGAGFNDVHVNGIFIVIII